VLELSEAAEQVRQLHWAIALHAMTSTVNHDYLCLRATLLQFSNVFVIHHR
jgi:hypothetical protein